MRYKETLGKPSPKLPPVESYDWHSQEPSYVSKGQTFYYDKADDWAIAKKLFKKVTTLLKLPKEDYELRKIIGGVAVPLMVIFHHKDVYVSIERGRKVLIRNVKNKTDYTGDHNEFLPITILNSPRQLANAISHYIQKKQNANNPPKLVRRWESRGKKEWLELYQQTINGNLRFSYKTKSGGGVMSHYDDTIDKATRQLAYIINDTPKLYQVFPKVDKNVERYSNPDKIDGRNVARLKQFLKSINLKWELVDNGFVTLTDSLNHHIRVADYPELNKEFNLWIKQGSQHDSRDEIVRILRKIRMNVTYNSPKQIQFKFGTTGVKKKRLESFLSEAVSPKDFDDIYEGLMKLQAMGEKLKEMVEPLKNRYERKTPEYNFVFSCIIIAQWLTTKKFEAKHLPANNTSIISNPDSIFFTIRGYLEIAARDVSIIIRNTQKLGTPIPSELKKIVTYAKDVVKATLIYTQTHREIFAYSYFEMFFKHLKDSPEELPKLFKALASTASTKGAIDTAKLVLGNKLKRKPKTKAEALKAIADHFNIKVEPEAKPEPKVKTPSSFPKIQWKNEFGDTTSANRQVRGYIPGYQLVVRRVFKKGSYTILRSNAENNAVFEPPLPNANKNNFIDSGDFKTFADAKKAGIEHLVKIYTEEKNLKTEPKEPPHVPMKIPGFNFVKSNPEATKKLIVMKKKKKRYTPGDVNEAVIAAAAYAESENDPVFVYPTNRYGHYIYALTYKMNDAISYVMNQGGTIYLVYPNCIVDIYRRVGLSTEPDKNTSNESEPKTDNENPVQKAKRRAATVSYYLLIQRKMDTKQAINYLLNDALPRHGVHMTLPRFEKTQTFRDYVAKLISYFPQLPWENIAKESSGSSVKSGKWFENLSEPARQKLFALMRDLGNQAEHYHDKARKLAPQHGHIPAGGAAFDETIKGEIINSFLRAIRKGETPDEARQTTMRERTSYVQSFNKTRGKDYVTHRNDQMDQSFIDDIWRRIRNTVKENTLEHFLHEATDYVKQFKALNKKPEKFQSFIKELGNLPREELRQIASKIIGHDFAPSKSKKYLIDMVTTRHQTMQRAEARVDHVHDYVGPMAAQQIIKSAPKVLPTGIGKPIKTAENQKQVLMWVYAIEATYQDDQKFKIVMDALQARGKVPEDVIRDVASYFSSGIRPKTKRAEALKRIKSYSKNWITLDLKNKAMGNRSAG